MSKQFSLNSSSTYTIKSADLILFDLPGFSPVVHRFWTMIEVSPFGTQRLIKEIHGLGTSRSDNLPRAMGLRVLDHQIVAHEFVYENNVRVGVDSHSGSWSRIGEKTTLRGNYNGYLGYNRSDVINRKTFEEGLTSEQAEAIWGRGLEAGNSINSENIDYELYGIVGRGTNSNSTHYTVGEAMGAEVPFFEELDSETWAPGTGENLNGGFSYQPTEEDIEEYKKRAELRSKASSLGGQIASYLVDDNFATQLIARSMGSSVGGWVYDVNDGVYDQSLDNLASPELYLTNLVSTAVALGSEELSTAIIEALKIEDELSQVFLSIGVNTLSQAVINYAFTSAAIEYFPQFAAKYLSIDKVANITIDNLQVSFSSALASYAASYASNELYESLVRWNIISESQLNEGSAIGGSVGGTVGGLVGSVFPVIGTWVGSFLGSIAGSLIGGLFGDEDFPRAAYLISVLENEYVNQFSYELDDGNTELAKQMGDAAQQILNLFADVIDGQLIEAEDVYYGHYLEDLVYQPEDDAPGRSSRGGRVSFDDVQAAIEAGAVYQLQKTLVEGGDLYIKRALTNLDEPRGTLEQLNQTFQAAKEYGVYKDNPSLYQNYVDGLDENAISDADERIIELRSRPWERFVPPSLNEDIIIEASKELSAETIELSLEEKDLVIDGRREPNWVNTQPKNKPQFIRFSDGNLYNIVVYTETIEIPGLLDSDPVIVTEETRVKLELYTPDPTVRDLGLEFLPSEVNLSLNGNNLVIEGEVISNWLTTTEDQLEILRFADGSRFQIVAENGAVQLQHEVVANWNDTRTQATALNLDTPQTSDYYKAADVTQIIQANGGTAQGENDSDDVLISSTATETLSGGLGDDIYRYNLGDGPDTIQDAGGVDTLELGKNIQLADLTLTQNGKDLILNISTPNNASNPAANRITLKNIANSPIELIRLSNNEEYQLDNTSGQWQLVPTGSIQFSSEDNTTLQGTLSPDTLRATGENATLEGGAGNDIYLYALGDGNLTTIYDTGDYEGIVRDGGTDTLVLATNTIPLLKLQDKDLIISVAYIPASFETESSDATPQPVEIKIKDWAEENSRIEFIRLSNGQDYVPTIQQDGSITLQPAKVEGESTLDVQLDVPESYELSSRNLAVVDLRDDGLQLISAQDSFAMSDQDDDGSLEQTGWVSPLDGFLVLDRNSDGQIAELDEFISLTAQSDVTHINALNTNGDDFLNYQDTTFDQLRVWTDNNGNNRVELGELAALHRYGIADISLISQSKNYELAGNQVTASAYFTQLGYRYRNRSQIFDVAFAYNPDGVKLEELGNGLNQFTFENKPNIIIADSTANDLNLEIDPALTYSVTGGDGNDTLRVLPGSTAGAILNGGDGNDTLIGGDGFDILNGAGGKDVIKGGGGDDTITVDQDDFLFALDGGDGFDIVTIDERDRFHLKLSDRSNIESIIGNRAADKITYSGSNSVLISGGTGNDNLTGGDGDDQIEGGEGDDELAGSGGNDLLLGSIGEDRLYGGDDDDQLYGQEGDDYLEGGQGNDYLDGSIGNDILAGGNGQNTYIFGRDYGVDTIDVDYNNTGIETVSFRAGITLEDITFWRKSDSVYERDNLYIAIKDTHDRLIIKDQFAGSRYGVDQFIFADGTTLEIADVKAQLLESTDGDDNLFGYDREANVLDGGAGNDKLDSDSGENVYVFGRGYDIDTITTSYNSNDETVRFNLDVAPADIIFTRKSGGLSFINNLQISIKDTLDQLIIEDQFSNDAYSIDQFVFADGTIWTEQDVEVQLLQSTDGDDALVGYTASDDVLQGDAGNDTLDGNSGQNTYIFGRGDGVDTILSNYNTGVDTLKFKEDISPEDVLFRREHRNTSLSRNKLYFEIEDTSDQIIVESQFFSGDNYGIDKVVFADGTTWTRAYIESQLLQSTAGDDILTAYHVRENSPENLLDGGAGNDILNGRNGQNIYRFGRGDGVDRITSNYNTRVDILQLKDDISPTDISFARVPGQNELYIAINNTADRIIIENQFYGNGYGIDQIEFSNGITITRNDIDTMSLPESIPGDDILIGNEEENTLSDASGNDLLQGGAGDDVYIFNRGHGQDTIEEGFRSLNSYYDIVKFGSGLTPETMEIVREGDDLVFIVSNTTDRLTIKDQFDASHDVYSIEEFQFDGGKTVWTKEDIKQYLLAANSTDGNDFIAGYSTGINSETLDGGSGNDLLEGGAGDDTYIFKKGYGQDIISDGYVGLNSFDDTVSFGTGLTPDTMNIFRQGDHLIFDANDTRDRLTVENQFDQVYDIYAIEEFSFNNGALVWTKEDIKQHLLDLTSTEKDDQLLGYSTGINNETLDAKGGNDLLEGGAGDDTYIFERGYGQDIILEDYYALNSYFDTVIFGEGLTLETMNVFRQDNDLVFNVEGSDDRLTIKNQFDYVYEIISIEEFQFDNGSAVFTKDEIKSYILSQSSTSGDDHIVGYSEGTNNETIDGGLGNDVLEGGTGDDTYIFKQGYGQDIIRETYYALNSYYDTVQFGAGLTPETMEIVRKGNDLVFKVNGSSDRLTIENQFDRVGEVDSVEEFQFDNSAIVWTKEDIKRYLLEVNSTEGDDHLVGYSWTGHDDTLDGGAGYDLLEGGFGDDTYIFKAGYGKDTIQEASYGSNSYYDTVKLGVGLTPETLEILRQGDDLVLKLKGEEDELTIKRQFGAGEYYAIEEFQFDDGATIWTKEDIKQAATTVLPAPILAATSFDVVNDHIATGEATITFTIENKGTANATAFDVGIIHSDDDIIGNADDVFIDTVTIDRLTSGQQSTQTKTVQLSRDVLNGRAQADDLIGLGSDHVSDSYDYLGIIVDPDSQLNDDVTPNDVLQGKGIDKDDVTYFPWDIDGNGIITPTDSIFVINRLGQSTPAADIKADFDGNGLITPTDAIAAINRLGYSINPDVFE
ncbi:calcium-binding protein [cf. Phormidesmis sp. LEGE 11477]|uniref:calcium-binding protein n=1 Tax=cf. Phormidesmis sp. LEGE 11477 TaxID=1828680 RepID=UPI00187EF3A0|nr:calcium-binding protein [cf. Phormidesmis sp. LEGE 11477]MBE9061112.1 hypothetical protein [cf. Phormidesmis sp. LEGE 11477]